MNETKKILFESKQPIRESVSEDTYEVLDKIGRKYGYCRLCIRGEGRHEHPYHIISMTQEGLAVEFRIPIERHTRAAFIFWRNIEWISFVSQIQVVEELEEVERKHLAQQQAMMRPMQTMMRPPTEADERNRA